ncbi:MAG: hypothetical protein ACOYIE_00565 [Agathobaculum sp.]|uniref:hypothetical protein n=1 Tax=Agathobaculum sp. TaxID=2048138 RepID=UPI003D93236F
MTSRNCSSKGMLRDSTRRSLWAFVLSGVGFFLSMLLPTLMTMQHSLERRATETSYVSAEALETFWQSDLAQVAELIGGYNPFIKIVFIVMAVSCGVALFAYLHSRQKVDFYHSLPVTRTKLFFNNFATGVICTLTGYLVMYGITLACVYAMGFGAAVNWSEIGAAVISNVILFLLLYALSVLTTVLCGNTVITLLLLAWVHLSPALVRLLFSGLCGKFLDTFVETGAMDGLGYASPVVHYFLIDGMTYHNMLTYWGTGEKVSALPLLAGYLIAAVLVTALACRLFRIRKSERSGMALAFEPLKLPVKVYMCLTAGAAFGMLFELIAGSFWFWPGLVIGTVLFHWIVEIIYAMDFHAMFHKPVHLAAILVVLVCGMLLMKFDVFGYDRWMPERDELTGVDLDSSRASVLLTDEANIDAVYRLAEIAQQPDMETGEGGMTYRSCFVIFERGSRITMRRYVLPETEEVVGLVDSIYCSEEYKQKRWPLFLYETGETENGAPRLDFYTNASGYRSVYELWDAAQIEQIVRTLQEESLTRAEDSRVVMRIAMHHEKQNGSHNYEGDTYVTDQDVKTLALIEQFTGVRPQPLTADMLETTHIEYFKQLDEDNGEWVSVEVTDKADVEALLKDAVSRDMLDNGRMLEISGLYFAEDQAENKEVYVQTIDGEQWELFYPQGKYPAAVVEKYRPEGTSSNGPFVEAAA